MPPHLPAIFIISALNTKTHFFQKQSKIDRFQQNFGYILAKILSVVLVVEMSAVLAIFSSVLMKITSVLVKIPSVLVKISSVLATFLSVLAIIPCVVAIFSSAAINFSQPIYLSSLIKTSCLTCGNRLSLSSASHKKAIGRRGFVVASPIEWNRLPQSVRSQQTITGFRSQLKTYLFRLAYPPP